MATVPDYLLNNLCKHIYRVIDKAQIDWRDTQTQNAARLLRKELAAIEKKVKQNGR